MCRLTFQDGDFDPPPVKLFETFNIVVDLGQPRSLQPLGFRTKLVCYDATTLRTTNTLLSSLIKLRSLADQAPAKVLDPHPSYQTPPFLGIGQHSVILVRQRISGTPHQTKGGKRGKRRGRELDSEGEKKEEGNCKY